ncbi:hypothetical protein M5K25_024919 [Dendrobium thyrsiflorum]|uniref:Uncharacterized protein n=1 Tax=Dendrobium thyrsiflorum TaxID=117978 RepID=A0ABD0U340_DENTH
MDTVNSAWGAHFLHSSSLKPEWAYEVGLNKPRCGRVAGSPVYSTSHKKGRCSGTPVSAARRQELSSPSSSSLINSSFFDSPVTVRHCPFDVIPFSSDRKPQYFDPKQRSELARGSSTLLAVRLGFPDDFPFLSDRKLRHFDRRQDGSSLAVKP